MATCHAGQRSPRPSRDLHSDVPQRLFARGADLCSGESPLPLPSSPLIRGDRPARLSAQADVCCGRPAALSEAAGRASHRSSVVMLPRGYPPGALMSATAVGLRPPSRPPLVGGSLQSSNGRGRGGRPLLPLPADCPRSLFIVMLGWCVLKGKVAVGLRRGCKYIQTYSDPP